MKKICLLSLVLTLTTFLNIFAAPIRSYQELTSAMRAGHRLVILLDLQQCTEKSGMPMGYFTPSSMMLIPATKVASERVVTSHLHFTDHSGSPTYEYVKYTFNADNSVMVRTVIYDPQSFKPIGASHTINCTFGKGIEINSDAIFN